MKETFTIIDPTTGRIHSSKATAREVEQRAVVIAGCRGIAVVINNDSEEAAEWKRWAETAKAVAHA